MTDRSHVVLLCPRIPPTRDGVGDYTYCLAAELAKTHRVTIVTTEGQQPTDGPCAIRTVPSWNGRGLAALWPILAELRPAFVNIQWVPFLWGRWGVNLMLPLFVHRLRRAGYPVVTTIHETYVPFDTWTRLPMGILQRLELWTIILGSAKVAVTVSGWTELLRRRFFWRKRDIFWLPVGSNIPRTAISDAERNALRRTFGVDADDLLVVMFNPRGSGKMIDLSARAWTAIRREHPTAMLALIGCEEHELDIDQFPCRDGVVCTGYLDAGDVSRHLSSADICLAPYLDGMSARRGSVIAAMAHGVPVVSTRGHLTDSGMFERSPLVLVDVDDEDAFVDAAARLGSDRAAQHAARRTLPSFLDAHFTWTRIGTTLLRHAVAGSRG